MEGLFDEIDVGGVMTYDHVMIREGWETSRDRTCQFGVLLYRSPLRFR